MSPQYSNLSWQDRWRDRGEAVFRVLGETLPPSSVVPFSWVGRALPGACALTFAPNQQRHDFLYMTLGLTQPLAVGDPTFPWEFAIRTREQAAWPIDLLYQLTTHWMDERGAIGFGHHLPFRFTYDSSRQLQASIATPEATSESIGDIAGLYLWLDELGLKFETQSGPFGLLTIVGVTLDEDQLADESSPAHVMLLLRRLGVAQVSDPFRKSVLSTQSAVDEWNGIKNLDHDHVLAMLQG